MSEYGYKRKRDLQDSPVKVSKMTIALNRLEAIKKELDGIENIEDELYHTVSDHVLAVENILKGDEKRKMSFSTVAKEDLKEAGVMRKRLVFNPEKVAELTRSLTTNAEAEIVDLHSRIKNIYEHVNMYSAPGPHMILDAILLALTEIASTQNRLVAILPGLRIAQTHKVQISHPVSGYELWLSGKVDYAILESEDVKDNKARLLDPVFSRELDAIEVAKGHLVVIQAKYESPEQTLISYIPEAVSQGIALLRLAKLQEVRFCLSDGPNWIFFILKSENGTLTYYESITRSLSRHGVKRSDLQIREIVQLIGEWLRPTMSDLFELE